MSQFFTQSQQKPQTFQNNQNNEVNISSQIESSLLQTSQLQEMSKLFLSKQLTGYTLAKNNNVADQVKKDSTQFTNQVIKHIRGKQIIGQLMDIVLRPGSINKKVFQRKLSQDLLKENENIQKNQNQANQLVYNALQILTNQYEQFVQFVFQKQKDEEGQKQSQQFLQLKQNSRKSSSSEEEDCVIIECNMPQLTKNQEDSMLRKISDMSKLNLKDYYKSQILERMFKMFDQENQQQIKDQQQREQENIISNKERKRKIVQQTPVSYFNKILLQFVYQKPQQLMKFFYCIKSKIKHNKNVQQKQRQTQQKIQQTILESNQLQLQICTKISKISKHLSNSSVIQTLLHILELQNQNNFYIQEKIQMLKTIVYQVFVGGNLKDRQSQIFFQNQKNKNNIIQNNDLQTSSQTFITESQISQARIENFNMLLRLLYQKLQDKYEQQKYLPIFKYFLNSQQIIQMIVKYFTQNFKVNNSFSITLISNLLTQILKFDQINFKQSKKQNKSSNDKSNNFGFGFGGKSGFGGNNNNQEQSSIASYDLKLSKQVVELIGQVINKIQEKITTDKQQSKLKITQLIAYYDLLYSYINLVFMREQKISKSQSILLLFNCSLQFINTCLSHFLNYPRSTILHNIIKSLLIKFIPKLYNSSVNKIMENIILNLKQCKLLKWIVQIIQNEKQKEQKNSQSKKNKKKNSQQYSCLVNQCYHIGKMILNLQQQYKLSSLFMEEDNKNIQQQRQSLQLLTKLSTLINKKTQFYEHLICGDPRKIGQYHYQEQQNADIIISVEIGNKFKNFFGNKTQEKQNTFKFQSFDKNNQNHNNQNQDKHIEQNNKQKSKISFGNNEIKNNNRYNNNQQEENNNKNQIKSDIDKDMENKHIKKVNNLLISTKQQQVYLRTNNPPSHVFQSVISPLNSNTSHTFNNFDFDNLPLDSDHSDQVQSQQQPDLSTQNQQNQKDIKLMQDNLDGYNQKKNNLSNFNLKNFIQGNDLIFNGIGLSNKSNFNFNNPHIINNNIQINAIGETILSLNNSEQLSNSNPSINNSNSHSNSNNNQLSALHNNSSILITNNMKDTNIIPLSVNNNSDSVHQQQQKKQQDQQEQEQQESLLSGNKIKISKIKQKINLKHNINLIQNGAYILNHNHQNHMNSKQKNIKNHRRSIEDKVPQKSNLLLLNVDNYRQQQLSKSIDVISQNQIEKVDSLLIIQSPRKSQEQKLLQLQDLQKIIPQNQNQFQEYTNIKQFLKKSQQGSKQYKIKQHQPTNNNYDQINQNKSSLIQSVEQNNTNADNQTQYKKMINSENLYQKVRSYNKKNKINNNQDQLFNQHYSLYLSYDLDSICSEIQDF